MALVWHLNQLVWHLNQLVWHLNQLVWHLNELAWHLNQLVWHLNQLVWQLNQLVWHWFGIQGRTNCEPSHSSASLIRVPQSMPAVGHIACVMRDTEL